MKKYLLLLTVLLALLGTNQAMAQNSVSGRVSDVNGEPLMGVVVMAGKGNATMTDNQGRYNLNVASDATLEFSCMGYTTVNAKVNGRSVVNVVMDEDVMTLEETVVVGYGVQKKVNLTGSVSAISSDALDSRPLMNTASGLGGLAAGMVVRQSSGQPGEEDVSIRIRGNTTLNTNSPLVLVDGIEWSMNNINTLDIASISVLKDAASTAIYGSRAANGVILITTKTGSKDKTKVDYSFSAIWQQPYNKLSWVSDYATHMELVNESCDNVGQAHIFSDSSIETWRAAAADPYGTNDYGVYNYMAYPNTDWFDVLFNTGFSQQHNFSVSGGSDKINYLISFGYLDNEGVMNVCGDADSSTQKFDFRVNVEAQVTDWIKVGVRAFGNRQSYGLSSVSNAFSYIYQTTPGVYPGEPGKWGRVANTAEESSSANNIMRLLANTDGHNITYRVNASLYAIFTLYKGLDLEVTGNYAPTFTDKNTYTVNTPYWDYTTNTLYSETNLDNATNTNSTTVTTRTNTEILLRYNGQTGKHEYGGLAGFSTNRYKSRSFSIQKLGATDWSITEMSTYTTNNSSSSSTSEWSLMSFFGRINYAYDGKYLFEANIRSDGSSRFSPDSRWGIFPSFSAGWRMNKENWLKSVNWLSNLKIRASWGVTGNNNSGNYAWQSTYSAVSVVIDGTDTKGLMQTALGNDDLEWETTYTTNVGVDFGFFNNKLTGEVDAYVKNTDGILYVPTVYETMGNIDGAYANLASVRNTGFEFTINWKDRIGKDFHYGVNLNVAYNYNKVTKYNGKLVKGWYYDEDGNLAYQNNLSDVSTSGFGGMICEGYQLGDQYLYKVYKGTGKGYSGGDVDITAGPKDGMIRSETDMAWVQAMIDAGYSFCGVTTIAKDQLWYGDLLYQDLDGDGTYGDSDDREFTGRTYTPKYNVGLTLSASYKGFDFSALFSGAFRFWLNWTTQYYNTTKVTNGHGISQRIADDHYFYDPSNLTDSRTNVNGEFPRLMYSDDLNNSLASDFRQYRGDYVKLKNIQLGYTFPTTLTQKFKVSRLRLFASMENIFTITNYPGMDPEAGTTIGYPLMKSYSFGAQVTF